MTDLLDRIAAAVARELVLQAQACGEYQTRDCYKVADAVIRELGLPPTWGKPSFENGTTDD